MTDFIGALDACPWLADHVAVIELAHSSTKCLRDLDFISRAFGQNRCQIVAMQAFSNH